MTDSTWYIRLFVSLKAEQGELAVTHFRTQKTAELLAYLAYYLHSSHTRDKLIDVLWPEIDPDIGRSRFKQTLALLRRVLEPDDVPAGSVLATSGGNVQVRPGVVCTDVGQFAAAIRAAETADRLSDKVSSLTRAVELYAGDLLPGCYHDWVECERRRLVNQYVGALCQLALIHEQTGDLAGAIEYARRAVSTDPMREEAHCDLMRLYAATGQPSGVWRQFNELERILRDQFDGAPLQATRALAEKCRIAAWSSLVAHAGVSLAATASRQTVVSAYNNEAALTVDGHSYSEGAEPVTASPSRRAHLYSDVRPVPLPISVTRAPRRSAWIVPMTGLLVVLGAWIGQRWTDRMPIPGAAQSDRQGHIVFAASRNGEMDIYRIDSDGTHERRLTDNPAPDYAPAWSPDGSRIAFTSERDGNAEIYVMDADGSHQRRLTYNPAKDAFPSWLQDGREIAFVSDRAGREQIYVIGIDGSRERRVTGTETVGVDPVWKDRPADSTLLARHAIEVAPQGAYTSY